jgi:hypothetical protein
VSISRNSRVCGSCGVEYAPNLNGVYVVEMMARGRRQVPYKVWIADRLECPHCGNLIIAGFGDAPIRQHFDEDFKEWYADLMARRYRRGVVVVEVLEA